MREATSDSVNVIVNTVKDALDEAPPEIVADLMDMGVCMAGGGSQLQGLDERLSNELNIRAWVAEDPMSCVARGAGIALEDRANWESLFVGLGRAGRG